MSENMEMQDEYNESSSDDSSQEDDEMSENKDTEQTELKTEVYLPGKELQEGEELVCDQSAYLMLHQAQTGSPCLSFDIIQDSLGSNRDEYPLTTYLVAGSQAPRAHVNSIIVMKMSNLTKTGGEEIDEDDDDSDDEDAKRPNMKYVMLNHHGCVNRIRATVHNSLVIAASWSEFGKVNIWDLTPLLQATDNPALLAQYKQTSNNHLGPLFTFSGHQQEGFALDWCSTAPGVLATGDCRHDIHIWNPSGSGTWLVDQRPLIGHTASVEDIQWSPNERNVFSSCSVDKSIRIWDTRAQPHKACMLTAENAHESDVNVISWNKNEPFIASGGDDGFLHIWDLRHFHSKTPVATFKHHTAPVTTLEWHPTDATVFASGGSDNQIALWDLSVEKDDEGADENEEVEGIPPQLLFIHQGQTDIKELHWHPQIPGVIISTAHSGFNIFKTISV